MRGLIVVGVMMLALPAAAQTAITIPTAPCVDPPRPAPAAAPVTPSIAAGSVAASNRDFALALANFKPLAEQGNADAERAMGQLLMQNCTGLQDKPAALEWLNKAAAAGNMPAKKHVGFGLHDRQRCAVGRQQGLCAFQPDGGSRKRGR